MIGENLKKDMEDKYSKAIEYLNRHPSQILEAWNCPRFHPAGCLFQYTSLQNGAGCLTQIRAGNSRAHKHELTLEIRADERVPKDQEEITLNDLPVFAEWQRKIDKIGR
jgi:hypothetical protein